MPSLSSSYPLLLLLLLFTSLAHAATNSTNGTCFHPKGNTADDEYPCTASLPSACCPVGSACVSNGLCILTPETTVKTDSALYSRGSCTDPDWNSTACPTFCLDPVKDNLYFGEGVVKCTIEKYYCIRDESVEPLLPDMCSSNRTFTLAVGNIIATIETGGQRTLATATSAITTTTATHPPTLTSTPSSTSSSSGLDTSAKIAIGVLVPIAALALLAASWLLYRWRRSKRALARAQLLEAEVAAAEKGPRRASQGMPPSPPSPPPLPPPRRDAPSSLTELDDRARNEMDGRGRVEMGKDERVVHELDGGKR